MSDQRHVDNRQAQEQARQQRLLEAGDALAGAAVRVNNLHETRKIHRVPSPSIERAYESAIIELLQAAATWTAAKEGK